MEKQNNHEKIIEIYRLLFEIATGKRKMQVPKQNNNELLDELFNILLSVDQHLQEYLTENNIANPYHPYQNLTQLIFILDAAGQVVNFNQEVNTFLELKPKELSNLNFESILTAQFVEVWHASMKIQTSYKNKTSFTRLTFQTKSNKIFPALCTITFLAENKQIAVTSIISVSESIVKINEVWDLENDKDLNEKNLVLKLQNYIMDHLNEPLPSLKAIAKYLNSEEHILKVAFRKYFNTSVYQFYQDERLKKAEILILQTAIPLKEIAFLCGFNSYLNFYKSFKKKYNYPPSDLLRKKT